VVGVERKSIDKQQNKLDTLIEQLTNRLEQQDTELGRLRTLFSISIVALCVVAAALAIKTITTTNPAYAPKGMPETPRILNVSAALRRTPDGVPSSPTKVNFDSGAGVRIRKIHLIGGNGDDNLCLQVDGIAEHRAHSDPKISTGDPFDTSSDGEEEIPIAIQRKGWKFWTDLTARSLKASFSTGSVPQAEITTVTNSNDPIEPNDSESTNENSDVSTGHTKKLNKHKRLKSTDI